jgi:hypothetical protein
MMVDEDEKATPKVTPQVPVPTNQTPQMPVSATPSTPAQTGTGGTGPQPNSNSSLENLGQLLEFLKQGKGPIRPNLTRRPPPVTTAPYDYRSDIGGTKPAFTKYEGDTTVDPISGMSTFTPKLDDQGKKIITTAGRDLDYEEAMSKLPAGEELPETQTRIKDIRATGQAAGPSPRTSAQDLMEPARFDASVEKAFQAGQINEGERNAELGKMQRGSFLQGSTSELGEEEQIKRDRQRRYETSADASVRINPHDQPAPVLRHTLRVDTVMRSIARKGTGNTNPFSLIQATHSQLSNEIRQNNSTADQLEAGNIGVIATALGNKRLRNDHPFYDLAQTSYGKTLEQVELEYQRTTGTQLFSPSEKLKLSSIVKTAVDTYRTDAQNLQASVGYNVLSSAIDVADQQQFNTTSKNRIGNGAIAYIHAIPRATEIDTDTARSYFNLSLHGDPSMEMYKQGIEAQLSEDVDYGVFFKRGAEGIIAKSNVGNTVIRGATADVFKNAMDTISQTFVTGANNGRTARQGQVKILNAFLNPIYDAFANGSDSGAGAINKTKFGSLYFNELAYNMQVLDNDSTIKQIFQSNDTDAKRIILDQITAPFGIKRAMQNLFTFDIEGKEDAFEADSIKIADAIKSGDLSGAKNLLSPYASTDQLDALFGDDVTVQGTGKNRDIKLLSLEDITGAGKGRKTRIDEHLGRMKSFTIAQDKYDTSNLKMSPNTLFARLIGSYKLDESIFGGYSGETKSAFNTGYLRDQGDEKILQQSISDIEHYLAPLKGKEGSAYVDDPMFTQTLTALDDTINKLKFNVDSGNLSPQQDAAATELLKQLNRTRTKALGNLDLFVEQGQGRNHLFRMTADGLDYSQPIRAVGSASRVAQVTDMLAAWITNTPGVNINRYFKGEQPKSNSNVDTRKVLVTPVDTLGRAIPSTITKQVLPDKDGFVQYPVYHQVDGKWVPKLDFFGQPQTTTQPVNVAQQAIAGLYSRANADKSSGTVINRDYVLTQINDLRSHLQNIIEPSGSDELERRQYLTNELGIAVNDKSKISNDDVARFLQKATPEQGRKLLGYLEMYGQSETLRPDTRVNWTMNATSTRGKSKGTEGNAIDAFEKESVNAVRDQHRTTMYTMASSAKSAVRAYADEIMSGIGISDENTRASANEQIMKSLIRKMPELGADNLQVAQVRDYLRDYIDAVTSDDTKEQTIANKKLRDFIEDYEVTPQQVDEMQKQIISRGTKLNLRKPPEVGKLNTAEILEESRRIKTETSKTNRAAQTYYHTAFFPQLGWVHVTGTQNNIQKIRRLEATAKNRGNSVGIDIKKALGPEATVRQANYKEIELVKRNSETKKVSDGTSITRKPQIYNRVTRQSESQNQPVTPSKKSITPISETPAIMLKGKPNASKVDKPDNILRKISKKRINPKALGLLGVLPVINSQGTQR